MQEGNEEPFNIRLHLAKDILTIQEQDVICVSGEPFYSSVSNRARLLTCSHIEIRWYILYNKWRLQSEDSENTLDACVNDKCTAVNLFLINQM